MYISCLASIRHIPLQPSLLHLPPLSRYLLNTYLIPNPTVILPLFSSIAPFSSPPSPRFKPELITPYQSDLTHQLFLSPFSFTQLSYHFSLTRFTLTSFSLPSLSIHSLPSPPPLSPCLDSLTPRTSPHRTAAPSCHHHHSSHRCFR